jgi:hypothetical protein
MTDYVHDSYPVSSIDTQIIGNLLLEKPDKSRNYDIYSQYFYLVNGYYPTRQKSLIKRTFSYTKQKLKDNWFTKLTNYFKGVLKWKR